MIRILLALVMFAICWSPCQAQDAPKPTAPAKVSPKPKDLTDKEKIEILSLLNKASSLRRKFESTPEWKELQDAEQKLGQKSSLLRNPDWQLNDDLDWVPIQKPPTPPLTQPQEKK